MSYDMIKLKQGQAPGLTAGRPDTNGTARWRWVPGPWLRKKGYKSLYLLGNPGTALTKKDWLGLGFETAPTAAITLDGAPLILVDAITACQRLTATARTPRTSEILPVAARPKAAAPTLDQALDAFLDAAQNGRVKKRGKDGRKIPITAKTAIGYKHAYKSLRELAGDMAAKHLTRAELLGLYDIMIDEGKHHTAVASQRALSRALNWLREDPAWCPHLPPIEAYSRLGLGQPAGRLRMATIEEAEAMYQALKDPAGFAHTHNIKPAQMPQARPAAAAAWVMALWTLQRPGDTLAFTAQATNNDRLLWRQSKTNKKINLPLERPAQEARRLALASRQDCHHNGMLFMDTEIKQPYLRISKKTGVANFRRMSEHWTQARTLAGIKVPSLLGLTTDPFGEIIPSLCFSDARDTGVTRLFEAMQHQDGALAAVSAWHGSDVETLIKLFRHYLVLNENFANTAGEALRKHAAKIGYTI